MIIPLLLLLFHLGYYECLECGCPIAVSTANDSYYGSQLFVADWSGMKGDCVLQCDSGYTMVHGRSNALVSSLMCQQNRWTYSWSDYTGIYESDEPADISCVKTTSRCNTQFGFGGCPPDEVCSPSFSQNVKGEKSGCILTCIKGYRLINGGLPMQEIYFSDGSWKGRSTADHWTVITFDAGVAVNCVRTRSAQEQRGLRAIAAYEGTNKPLPRIPWLECGCDIILNESSPSSDTKKLFVAGWSGKSGDCILQCDDGYTMVANVRDGGNKKKSISSLMCTGGIWNYADSESNPPNLFIGSNRANVTCEKSTFSLPPCHLTGAVYHLGGCRENEECDHSKIREIKGGKSPCIFTCSRGYRMVHNGTVSLLEVWYAATYWRGRPTSNPHRVIAINNRELFISCVRYKTATERAAEQVPNVCGCSFTRMGEDPSQIVIRNRNPDGGNCEVSCKPGYTLMMSSSISSPSLYELSLAVCQSGTWIGKTMDMIGTIGMSDSPFIGCKKYSKTYGDGCLKLQRWLPLLCPNCAPDQLIPVPKDRSSCAFNCKPSYRLVVSRDGSNDFHRPRFVFYTGSEWKGVVGHHLLTTFNYGTQAHISCEPDTLPVPSTDQYYGSPHKYQSCESCSLPSKLSTCPPGKKCSPEFMPLWRTNEGCLQIRCMEDQKLQIFNKNAWSVAGQLDCQADRTWKTETGTILADTTGITCDTQSGSNVTTIERHYQLFKEAFPMQVLG